MALNGKNQTKSFASNKLSIDNKSRLNESDLNLQKINYLKETYH